MKQIDKAERLRRRTILHQLKEKERAKFIASLPAPKPTICELFEYLHRGDNPCENTLRSTRGFLKERGIPEETVVRWLEEARGLLRLRSNLQCRGRLESNGGEGMAAELNGSSRMSSKALQLMAR